METRAHYVAVGAFVLAVIIAGFVAVVSLGRVEFAQDLKRYYVFVRGSVSGLSRAAIRTKTNGFSRCALAGRGIAQAASKKQHQRGYT